jgi:hypothetical protein
MAPVTRICEGDGSRGIHRLVRSVELATVPSRDWQHLKCAIGLHNLSSPTHTGTPWFLAGASLDGVTAA